MIDTGVILHVTPRANKSGRVLLDIDQEVSNTEPTTSSTINSPSIQQRKISSTVAVRDGDTIALGGLIQTSRNRTRSGISLLRRQPLQWADEHQLEGRRWRTAQVEARGAEASEAELPVGQVLRVRACARLHANLHCRQAVIRPTGNVDRPFQVFEWSSDSR
jgi:hypothetical protein